MRDVYVFMHDKKAVDEKQQWSFSEVDSVLEAFKQFKALLAKAKHFEDIMKASNKAMTDDPVITIKLPNEIRAAELIDAKGMQHFFQAATKRLQSTCEATQKVAGGGQNGEPWYDGDLTGIPFDDFQAKAKEALVSNDSIAKQLPPSRDKLVEDRAITLYLYIQRLTKGNFGGMAQSGSNMAHFGSQVAPGWPILAPKWFQDGPRWPKMAPRWPRWPKMAQDGPRWPQDAPRWPQDGLKIVPIWPQVRPGPRVESRVRLITEAL